MRGCGKMAILYQWNDEVADRKRIDEFMFLKRALVTTKEDAAKEKKFWLQHGKRVRIQGKRGRYEVWISLHNESNLVKYPNVYRRK
jgi:hypothetical protein